MDINQLLCHMWPHDPSELSLKPKSSLVSSIPVPDSRDVRFEPKEKTHGNQLPESMPSSNVTVTCNVIDENNEQGDWGIKENKRVEPVNHQCEYPESTLVQEVNPRSLTSQSCACVVDRHDHSRRPIEEGANGGGRPSFARHPTRGAREGEVTLWKEAPGEAISPDLARGSRVHYHGSNNTKHRRFLMFVDKKIQELELMDGKIPKTNGEASMKSQAPARPSSKVLPKAKSKGPTQLVPFEEEDFLPEEEFDVIESAEMMPTYHSQVALDVAAMQTRMLNLENAMSEIITHLRSPTQQ